MAKPNLAIPICYNFICQKEALEHEEKQHYTKSFGENRAIKKENQIANAIWFSSNVQVLHTEQL